VAQKKEGEEGQKTICKRHSSSRRGKNWKNTQTKRQEDGRSADEVHLLLM